MAETLSNLSIIAYIIAGAFFVFSVFLWFMFKIPSVINDLSGKKARLTVAKIRQSHTAEFAAKRATSSKIGVTVTGTAKTDPAGQTEVKNSKLKTEEVIHVTTLRQDSEEKTEAFPDADCENDETTTLDEEGSSTELLVGEDAGTAPMASDVAALAFAPNTYMAPPDKLRILDEVMLIHTDEVI